ncbi:MAG: type II toxin-antitoxin system PemK/MazF family toxin, partial [Gammaproteobacteria bacterium]|nr:type II toxin-antitoxin system PemK/MazF family toxin [Gammaproteobacteria bacterium]
MKRGEIRWASMGDPQGSGPGYRRPVVVVSSNEFNQSLIQTVICVVVTSNLRLAEAPGNFELPK